jgi:hypothetical protein
LIKISSSPDACHGKKGPVGLALFKRFMMRKTILIALIISSLSTLEVVAQERYGSLVSVFAGAAYNLDNSLKKELYAENIIYDKLSLNQAAFAYGGALYTVRPSRFVFGGSGYLYTVTSKGNDGEARLKVQTGFLDVGYCYFNTDKWLAFPYAGIGGHLSNFKIVNTSFDKVFLLGKDTITAGENQKYKAVALAWDAGVSIKHFNKKSSTSHKIIMLSGVDIGVSFFFPQGDWHSVSTDDETGFSNDPLIVAPYLRVSFGIGAFKNKK